MATIASTSLTKFILVESEQLSGQILNLQNKQVIQNLLADFCEQKINLKFDTHFPNDFIQQEAELQGKIGVLKYLLDQSLQAEQLLITLKDN